MQEVAPGGRETHKLFVSEGKVVASLVMRPERCWPPLGGSSTMRRTIEPPADTAAMAERLVTHIGLEGYSEVEFRRTACGQPRLMEINARLSQSIELADAAGVDFAYLQLEWARGRRLPAMPRPRHARVGWLAGDLRVMAGSLVGSPPPRPCPLQSLQGDRRRLPRARRAHRGHRPRRPPPDAALAALHGARRPQRRAPPAAGDHGDGRRRGARRVAVRRRLGLG